MHSSSLSDLINKVIVDLVSDAVLKLINQRTSSPQSILVVFSGNAGLCYVSVLEQLALLPDDIAIHVLFSHSAWQNLSCQHIPLVAPLKNIHIIHSWDEGNNQQLNYDMLLLPELSLNSLAKSTNHIADNLVTTFIQEALLANKHIMVTFDYFYQQGSGVAAYRCSIEQQIAKLVSYEVEVMAIMEIVDRINAYRAQVVNTAMKTMVKGYAQPVKSVSGNGHQPRSKVISSSQVRCHNPQSPLFLNNDTLVTPLAMDIIRQRNIRIIKG